MPAETPGSSDPNLKRNRPPSRISNRPGPVMIDGKKRYPCGTCSLTFSTSGHAARHSRIHRGSRPYVCTFPGCGNRFSRQDNSLQHYKTHVSASRSSRDNELGYLLKSAAEIAQEDRYIALGKKALLDVTAIAVMHDVFDSKGKKTGEKLVRCVGADLATRLPRLKHEAAPPAHVIPTTGPQTASHQAAAALESHEATSSLPGTMVGGDPMGSVPVQSRLGPASAPQVSADGFVGSATASSISPGDGRGGPSHEIAYSTSVGGTTDGRAYGTIISNTVPVAFSDGSAVGMGAGVPTVGPGGTPASAPEGMPASEFGPASSAFPRGGNSGGTTDRILPVGASTLPQGGMAPYHPSPTQSRPTGPYGDVTQHNAGGAMPIPSPVASSDQIAMSRQTNFVHTAAPGSNPNASPAGPLMSQQQSPVVGAGSGMYGDGTSGGNVGSQGLVYNSWNPQVPASHRYYPPPRQTWRPSGPQQHPQGMVYHQGGYGLSPPRPYYPQASPSYPVGPSPPGMQGQQPPVPPGNDQGWRPRNEYGYN